MNRLRLCLAVFQPNRRQLSGMLDSVAQGDDLAEHTVKLVAHGLRAGTFAGAVLLKPGEKRGTIVFVASASGYLGVH